MFENGWSALSNGNNLRFVQGLVRNGAHVFGYPSIKREFGMKEIMPSPGLVWGGDSRG